MPKVKLNISRLSINDKIGKCRQIVTAITGNPNFPSPNPPLATITAALNDLDAATNAAASTCRHRRKSFAAPKRSDGRSRASGHVKRVGDRDPGGDGEDQPLPSSGASGEFARR